ncbi:MAG TPA: hypothetical protein DIT65_04245 [Cryomorphaceae bacterium]|nr:hypothetical protein [Cryomorphaceae bacterium]
MTALNRRRYSLLKFLALLSQIRWYNVLLLLIGQYLAALFVFEPSNSWQRTLADTGTHLTIWSSAFLLVFGFLINSFYDLETDTINRPKQTAFERLVSQSTSLRIAVLALIIGLLMAYTVSWQGLLFYDFMPLYYGYTVTKSAIFHLSVMLARPSLVSCLFLASAFTINTSAYIPSLSVDLSALPYSHVSSSKTY